METGRIHVLVRPLLDLLCVPVAFGLFAVRHTPQTGKLPVYDRLQHLQRG